VAARAGETDSSICSRGLLGGWPSIAGSATIAEKEKNLLANSLREEEQMSDSTELVEVLRTGFW
jgi:hypothetical protein